MSRSATWLLLLLTLVGPLLTQAEAASDLAHAWLCRNASDDRIEPIDGGVGDEPYLACSDEAALSLSLSPHLLLDGWSGLLTSVLSLSLWFDDRVSDVIRRIGAAEAGPPPSAARRQSQLRLFRF